MEEVQIFIKLYEELCKTISKGRRKINITESMEVCTKALNSLSIVYSIIPKEYNYMVYNTLLIAKIFSKETVSKLNTKRYNDVINKLHQALAKYENIPILNEKEPLSR